MEIHIAREGRQLGPYSLEEVQRKLSAGQVSLTDLAWVPGMANWVPLNSIPGVGSSASAAAAPPTAPPAAPLPPPYELSGAGGYYMHQPPTSGLAVTSLVLGILSLTLLPFFPSIPAVVTGHMARAEIKRAEGTKGGDGLAVAGLVTGYLSLAFFGLVIILMMTMFATFMSILPQIKNQINNLPADPVSVQHAHSVMLSCSAYASNHDGNYPMQLDDLVPEYIKRADLDASKTDGSGGYVYLGGRDDDESSKVLFFSKRPVARGKHVIAKVDGTVELEDLPPELRKHLLE